MSVAIPANSRGPILELTLPEMVLAVDIVVQNVTTGKTLTLNLPANWTGSDLILDFYRRTIRDSLGADRSAHLSPADNGLWITREPLVAGNNDIQIKRVRASTIASGTPGTVLNNTSIGALAWTSVANAKVEDGSSATAVRSTAGTVQTNYLRAENLGLKLPAGAVLLGIEPTVKKGRAGTGATVVDSRISLVKGGVIQATNKSKGAAWTGAGVEWEGYGGPADMWTGDGAYSLADLASSTFGVVISATITAIEGFNATALVDAVKLNAYYRDENIKANLRWDQGHY